MNIKILFRKIYKNRKWFGLNVLGLSVAFACTIMVYSYVRNELSYDKFHSKADRISRLTINSNTGKSSMIDARIWSGWLPDLKEVIPQIQDYVRLSSFRNAIVTIDEHSFYSKKVFSVDSTFFNVFDFELISGDEKTLFKHPQQVVVTQSIAKKYFGTTKVIGKQIKLLHQKEEVADDYTIKGVIKDFPGNSHFKAEFICSFNVNNRDNWSYSYLLLSPNIKRQEVQDSIQSYWDKRFAENEYSPIANLQGLTDIHLHSHKSRELEHNGNVNNIYLLISITLIILIIALINFANLNYVQFLSEKKNYIVKTVYGANRIKLAKEFLSEIFVLIIAVLIIGNIIVYYLSNMFGFNSIILKLIPQIIAISFIFLLITIVFSVMPFIYRKTNTSLLGSHTFKKGLFKTFLVLQFTLSIIAIISTLFLQKQINHINKLHPNAKNDDIIVMPNNPEHVVAKYETLKEQVLKHPEILQVSAVMEEPAGIVVDNFPYILGNDNSEDVKTINIMAIDSNFFSFFGIKPIAGTINLGTTTTIEWEQKAIQMWQMNNNNQEIPIELKTGFTPIRGKYIVNKMALHHMGIKNPQDAIGKSFQLDFMGEMFPKGEIIGVVDDFHYTNMYVEEKPLVMVARKIFSHCFLFRIDENNKSGAIDALKTEWEKLNPDIPFQYEFVTESYRKVYQSEYEQFRVIMIFSLISILLSAMGLFAMVSFTLNMKVKEIGIRKVNGANISEILFKLNKDFVKLIALAFVVASPVAYFLMQKWLQNFAYKTNLSWWVFVLAGVIALLIALLTVSWLTYSAARENPVKALRYE
jgi:putative ABC transport system permease protein